jgi:hypothetical protein
VNWLALSIALAANPPAPSPTPWRLYTGPVTHVGLRPAALVSSGEVGAGFTLQITTALP